jgi:hypothetical protein
MKLSESIPLKRIARLDVFGEDFFSTNPSVLFIPDGYLCCVKGLNYDREAIWYSSYWQAIDRTSPITTTNAIVKVDRDFHVLSCCPLDVSEITRDPRARSGVQDIRLVSHLGNAMAVGTALEREFRWSGQRWLVRPGTRTRVFVATLNAVRLEKPEILESPCGAVWEKNWIPLSSGEELILISNIHTGAKLSRSRTPGFRLRSSVASFVWDVGWSGSSPFVRIGREYLGILHRRDGAPPVYAHMICLLDMDFQPIMRSIPFTFEGKYVEFCCGIALNEEDDSIVVGYGVNDKEAVIAEFNISDILGLLTIKVHNPLDLKAVKGETRVSYEDLVRCVEKHTDSVWTLHAELNELVAQSQVTNGKT